MDFINWEKWLKPTIQDNVNLVKSYLKEDDVFVDIGANTGLFTKMIIDDLGSKYLSKVILFEPIPYLVSECKNKFKDIPNIIINDLALSDKKYQTKMLTSDENIGYNKIYQEGMEIHAGKEYSVNCISFSEWALENKINKVDFIKVDAEGHDINVIYGAFDFIQSTGNRPHILFEVGWYLDLEKKLIQDICQKFNYSFIDLGKDVLLIG